MKPSKNDGEIDTDIDAAIANYDSKDDSIKPDDAKPIAKEGEDEKDRTEQNGTTDTEDSSSEDDESGQSDGDKTAEGDTTETTTEDSNNGGEGDNSDGVTAEDLIGAAADEEKEDIQNSNTTSSDLTPELKYIVDKLPNISVNIKTSKGPETFNVKSYTQIPGYPNIEFATKGDEIAFNSAMAAQEARALQLQQEYQGQQSRQQIDTFNEKENESIQEDIIALQKSRDLPKFKVTDINDPGFDKDPASVEIQKVLDYQGEMNDQYLQAYNLGRPYRYIGFKEAYKLWRIDNPKTSKEQEEEDKGRREVSRRMGGAQGTTPDVKNRPTVPRGMSATDIVDMLIPS